MDKLDDLLYLNRVVRETLRCHSVVLDVVRIVTQEIVYITIGKPYDRSRNVSNNIQIPAKNELSGSIYELDYWVNWENYVQRKWRSRFIVYHGRRRKGTDYRIGFE